MLVQDWWCAQRDVFAMVGGGFGFWASGDMEDKTMRER